MREMFYNNSWKPQHPSCNNRKTRQIIKKEAEDLLNNTINQPDLKDTLRNTQFNNRRIEYLNISKWKKTIVMDELYT